MKRKVTNNKKKKDENYNDGYVKMTMMMVQ